jgi:hypothetical protein
MTDIRTAQRAYDNASPADTFTFGFWGKIGQADVEVYAFADVNEETLEVECINEVVLHKVDISGALCDEQIAELTRQATQQLTNKEI